MINFLHVCSTGIPLLGAHQYLSEGKNIKNMSHRMISTRSATQSRRYRLFNFGLPPTSIPWLAVGVIVHTIPSFPCTAPGATETASRGQLPAELLQSRGGRRPPHTDLRKQRRCGRCHVIWATNTAGMPASASLVAFYPPAQI